MPIFDVFPTATPTLGLPYKPTELLLTDWAYGSEKAIVHRFVSDSAQAFDKLVGVGIPVFDTSLGSDVIVEYGVLVVSSDVGYSYELVSQYERGFSDLAQAQELAKILLSSKDQAISQDLLVEVLNQILSIDSSVGSEVRLSPMFRSSLDSSFGYEKIQRLVRLFKDSAIGFETQLLEVLAKELANAIETVVFLQASTTRVDLATGIETRLSPIPIFTVETTTGLEVISGRFRPLFDSASGIERAFWGYLAKDSSKGSEKLVEIYREIKEMGYGLEKRLSPVPLEVSEISYGKDISKIAFKEQLALDSVIGSDRLVFKASSFRDEAIGYEIGKIMLPTKDYASTLEKVIFKLITTYGYSSGLEKLLSPIPLRRVDIGSGIDYKILDKSLLELDITNGVETRTLEIPIQLPPESIGLQITTTHQSGRVSTKTNYSEMKLSTSIYIPNVRKAYSKLFEYYVNLTLKFEEIISKAIYWLIKHDLILNFSVNDIGYQISNTTKIIDEIGLELSNNVRKLWLFSVSKDNIIPIEMSYSKLKSSRYIQFNNERIIASISKKVSNSSLYSSKDIAETILSSLQVSQPFGSTPISLSTSEPLRLTTPQVGVSGISKYNSTSLVSKFSIMKATSTYSKDKILSTSYERIRFMNMLASYQRDLLTLNAPIEVLGQLSLSSMLKPKAGVTRYDNVSYYLKSALDKRMEFVNLKERFLEGMIAIIYRVLEAYEKILDLRAFLSNIRYVKCGDPVYPEDVNLFYDAFDLFVKFAETLYNEVFKDDEEVELYLNKLKEGLQNFKKIKSFDFIRTRDRNQVVDLIYRAREFLEVVWSKI
ncbi:MAG: hypothetical protein ACTSYJ_05010 [Candidatus Thorarchaeota archaeon]